jgi:hypothetical protein
MIASKPLPIADPRIYRPRRKPVTVAVGIPYDQGIVFCADTKVTNTIKGNESKLPFYSFDDGRCALQFAISSDDVNFPKSAIARCVEMVGKMDFSSASMEAVHDTAEFALAEFYRDHIYTHPDRGAGQVFIQMLLGIWLRNQTKLYVLHETVLMPVEEYECLGAGEYLSKYLIKQYKGANPEPFTLADAALMATVCVREAIDYDEKCGGEDEIVIMRNDGEISNAHNTAMYPNYSLPGAFRMNTWRLLHGLAEMQMNGHADRDAPGLVDEFCDRIREIEAQNRRMGSGNFPESLAE